MLIRHLIQILKLVDKELVFAIALTIQSKSFVHDYLHHCGVTLCACDIYIYLTEELVHCVIAKF